MLRENLPFGFDLQLVFHSYGEDAELEFEVPTSCLLSLPICCLVNASYRISRDVVGLRLASVTAVVKHILTHFQVSASHRVVTLCENTLTYISRINQIGQALYRWMWKSYGIQAMLVFVLHCFPLLGPGRNLS